MNKFWLKKQYLMHNPKKSSSRLPSGFQEVEYIESTGTQYIDTLLDVSSGMRFVSDFKFTNRGTTRYNPIMGTQINTEPWNGCFLRYATEYNALEYAEFKNRIPIDIGRKYNVDYTYTPTYSELRLDGVLKNQQTLSNVVITDYSMYLMGFHNGGNNQKSHLALYTAKFYINGELIRDFIPCYRKSDNEIGLYDIVNNQFYTNQGSGSFLKGKDIVNMDGYRQVEYIQGTGSSYIDLGVKSRSGLTIIVDDHLMKDTSGEAIVSGGDAWDVNFLQMGLGGWTNYNSQIYKTNHYLVLTRCIYKVDDSGIYINGELKQSWTPTSWNSTYNLFAFVSNRGGTLSDFNKNERLYKLEILENGVHIRDFYPVEEISTGKVGLYDVVSKRFFPSETSTNFIKGGYVE